MAAVGGTPGAGPWIYLSLTGEPCLGLPCSCGPSGLLPSAVPAFGSLVLMQKGSQEAESRGQESSGRGLELQAGNQAQKALLNAGLQGDKVIKCWFCIN